ncbi:hypothetical protein A2442_02210 [Candidatus Campbellbacteria bacterium RIFOXYC2_FULL_35_25]|uniref:Uncharacterized protein n=1 Tax=Candidatus Campbellbacteria bacterium RIFOXYC2_FULL_35_25 TaxID=1797582 RepID=A0A1F5EIZ9_9BACT|nr:MAG: hypothetical protein A2442_02210 [Candidatus Campbellbacteria bacterium RIFOXYC2_FULL_35_25]
MEMNFTSQNSSQRLCEDEARSNPEFRRGKASGSNFRSNPEFILNNLISELSYLKNESPARCGALEGLGRRTVANSQ